MIFFKVFELAPKININIFLSKTKRVCIDRFTNMKTNLINFLKNIYFFSFTKIYKTSKNIYIYIYIYIYIFFLKNLVQIS